jgi:integrase
MSAAEASPNLVIREAKDGTPWWEAKWRAGGRQVKRRITDGPAWAEQGPDDSGRQVWRARAGRAAPGSLSRDRAAVLAVALVAEVEAQEAAQAAQRAREMVTHPPTFRKVAHEWLTWLRDVKGCKPATHRDYAALLREPGAPFKRGAGKSKGRIMRAFGDRDVRELTPREVSEWLKKLDGDDLTPRNVNKYRQVVVQVLGYAMREDTYGLERNVASGTDKRREPAPAALDYYEGHEVERLAQAVADGLHRGKQLDGLSVGERLMRAEEDGRDADFFRVLFFTGMRLAELRALRWADVDLKARTVLVRWNVSAGVEVGPKGGRARFVPLTKRAVEVLRRQAKREHFTAPEDYVFAGRSGARLDDSALRRRYHGARKKAGLRKVKLHGLRHAAGSIYARQTSAVEVRDFLGHAKLATTDRYVSARLSPESLARLDEAFEHRPAPTGTHPPGSVVA